MLAGDYLSRSGFPLLLSKGMYTTTSASRRWILRLEKDDLLITLSESAEYQRFAV